MKFLLAVAVYLVIAVVLGVGIVHAVKGQPALLVVGFLAYVLAFARLGCLPRQSH